ncbi:MAG: MFS transporter [Bacillota bacterium]
MRGPVWPTGRRLDESYRARRYTQMSEVTPGNGSPIRDVLRDLSFVTLWLGQTVSQVGDWIANLAVLHLVYRLTGSGAAVGTLLAVQLVPGLLMAPIAGVYVDRNTKKKVLIAADIVRAVLVLLLPFTSDWWVLLAIMLLFSTASSFFNPAMMALLPSVVEGESRLVAANSLISTTQGLTRIMGPIIGGLIVAAAGERTAFLLDGVSFVVSIVTIWAFVRIRHEEIAAKQGGAVKEVAVGFREIAKHRLLLVLSGLAALALFCLGTANTLLVGLSESVLKAGAEGFGYLMAAEGAGSVLGAISLGLLAGFIKKRSAVLYSVAAIAGGLAWLGWNNLLIVAIVILAFMGAAITVWNVQVQTLAQAIVAPQARGRVFALLGVVLSLASLLGMAGAGILSDFVGIRMTFVVSGALLLAGVFVAWIPVTRADRQMAAEPLKLDLQADS